MDSTTRSLYAPFEPIFALFSNFLWELRSWVAPFGDRRIYRVSETTQNRSMGAVFFIPRPHRASKLCEVTRTVSNANG